ncbi:glycoside hydrolase family 26 protein [Pontibacter sp. E15-1]|uniref:glycoside hydrolase family 26 protein n=1 Tax=Pontibacter sp. E15-1 TaxID=2919918 RepID=UPI001F502A53|nr:glycosyl hydrolase [Pontibacter sp. E15-1]MCJ8166741.1 glycoside hydrolase family 26 protein [Pontibacter sp. E15-1]
MSRIVVAFMLASCFLQVSCSRKMQFAASKSLPVNLQATQETRHLYANLKQLSKKGVMFGHQDDLAYGLGWKYEEGRSDIKDVVGDYPAVVGWDLGHLELGSTMNLDSVPFDQMRGFARQVYERGGLNTFSWHLNNPLDPAKTSWDPMDSTIQRLFSDPAALKVYDGWLDKVADYLTSLKGPNGELIPVVFRPLHEHTGSWFWWGRNHVSPEDYKKMWRYTVKHLRDKGANNILIAYSTDRFTSREDYLERYPGDDYVDVLGFDLYHRPRIDSTDTSPAPDTAFIRDARRMVETVRQLGQEKNKLWAFTETGLGNLPLANWWTSTVLPVVQDAGLSYVLVWRNANNSHYFAPFPGQKSAEDFKNLYNRPDVFFMKDVQAADIYSAPPKGKQKKPVALGDN